MVSASWQFDYSALASTKAGSVLTPTMLQLGDNLLLPTTAAATFDCISLYLPVYLGDHRAEQVLWAAAVFLQRLLS